MNERSRAIEGVRVWACVMLAFLALIPGLGQLQLIWSHTDCLGHGYWIAPVSALLAYWRRGATLGALRNGPVPVVGPVRVFPSGGLLLLPPGAFISGSRAANVGTGFDISRPPDTVGLFPLPGLGPASSGIPRGARARRRSPCTGFSRAGAGPAEEMLLWVYDAFSGRKQYAFVQLAIPLVTPTGSGGEAEPVVLHKVARDLAPWARSVLEGH